MIDKRPYLAHRLAWLYVMGEFPKNDIDHVDTNGCNNKISNLRLATKSQNGANSKLPKNNTSGYKGVTWAKRNKKWMAQIMVDRKHVCLGFFHDPKLAYEAYKKASREYFGEFAHYG